MEAMLTDWQGSKALCGHFCGTLSNLKLEGFSKVGREQEKTEGMVQFGDFHLLKQKCGVGKAETFLRSLSRSQSNFR